MRYPYTFYTYFFVFHVCTPMPLHISCTYFSDVNEYTENCPCTLYICDVYVNGHIFLTPYTVYIGLFLYHAHTF